jgi:peptidoglycan hydrolase-like protein with peptidoglycan-binding domain
VFIDRSATVGDVQTLGADLVEPRAEVSASVDAVETAKNDLSAAQQELVDAQAALAAAFAAASSVPVSSATQTSITTTTLVPAATIERVQLAEQDLARAAQGINADTALVEAGVAYNSAALALEVAWLNLLNDAGCLSEQRQADAVTQLAAYTTALQTDLQRAGYDPGPIDGIYGPLTAAAVEKLQTDSGLPATGFVDEATSRALQDKLDAVGHEEAMQTAALQTALKVTGFWDGPIDGQWSDALTQALLDLQATLKVEPTGKVDAATIAAFQQALAALPTTVTSASTATATATATTTATETEIATATQTVTAITTATATTTASAPTTG